MVIWHCVNDSVLILAQAKEPIKRVADRMPPALEVGALFHSDERLTAEKKVKNGSAATDESCCKTMFVFQTG